MDLNKMVQGLMSSGIGGGLAGGLASGLLVNAVGKKKVGKAAGAALKLGGAAVVGGLAWKAYENYRDRAANGQPAVAHSGQPADQALHAQWQRLGADTFMPGDPQQLQRRDLTLLRAMITAAHADGHIDREERTQIFRRIETLELSAEEKSMMFDEILLPRSLEQLTAEASEPALAAEVYMAALLMLEPSELSARVFLGDLAEQLQIPGELVRAMHEQVRHGAAPGGQANRNTTSPQISPLA